MTYFKGFILHEVIVLGILFNCILATEVTLLAATMASSEGIRAPWRVFASRGPRQLFSLIPSISYGRKV